MNSTQGKKNALESSPEPKRNKKFSRMQTVHMNVNNSHIHEMIKEESNSMRDSDIVSIANTFFN